MSFSITPETLHSLFDYRPEDGRLIWKSRPVNHRNDRTWNTRWAGKVAGTKQADGRIKLSIYGRQYLAHRIIWLMHTGKLPELLDHIDGDASNNRLENLRLATQSQNNQNARLRSTNTSGYKGVYWHKHTRKWNGRVFHQGVSYCCGYHEDILIAAERVRSERDRLHGEFARHA